MYNIKKVICDHCGIDLLFEYLIRNTALYLGLPDLELFKTDRSTCLF